jgi:phosphopantothenoylcysteine decarboxylase/phosphopantothenate--cysteine ligase
VELCSVVSCLEMQAAVESRFPECQVAFGAAAIADFRPARRQGGKPRKAEVETNIGLVPNPDIVAGLGSRKGDRVVVGFALESANLGLEGACERGREKLRAKHLDLVVVNLDMAVGSDSSKAVLLFADGRREDLPEQPKQTTAEHLVRVGADLWQRGQA